MLRSSRVLLGSKNAPAPPAPGANLSGHVESRPCSPKRLLPAGRTEQIARRILRAALIECGKQKTADAVLHDDGRTTGRILEHAGKCLRRREWLREDGDETLPLPTNASLQHAGGPERRPTTCASRAGTMGIMMGLGVGPSGVIVQHVAVAARASNRMRSHCACSPALCG